MAPFQMTRPLSLSRSSAMEISKHLWSQPDVKYQILNMKKTNIWSFKIESIDPKDSLRVHLSNRIAELYGSIPKSVQKELMFVVACMGTRLSEWVQEMQKNGNSSVELASYIDHLHWTDNGCVDTSATLTSMYVSKALPENLVTWMELCKYCLEDCINQFWPEVSKMEYQISTDRPELVIYWCYRMENLRENQSKGEFETLITILPGYNTDNSLEENMIEYAFIDGNYSAVEYFWGWLDNTQRKEMTIRLSNKLIFNELVSQSDLTVFLLQQLLFYKLDSLRIELLGLKDVLIQLLKWPYQDFFMVAVEESWMNPEPINYTPIILEILRSMKNAFFTVGADSRYRKIFHEIWEKIITDRKESVIFVMIVKELWEMRDVQLLYDVINDIRLEDMRGFHRLYILRLFEDSKEPVSINFVEEFISTVLISEVEKKPFKNYAEKLRKELNRV